MKIAHKHKGNPWTSQENRLLVADYLKNRDAVAAGLIVNKAATIRDLTPQLSGRTKGSIEAKRMNLSALLLDVGSTVWPGYAPLANYQHGLVVALADVFNVSPVSLENLIAHRKGR
jgi:hypothetical protein